MNTQSWWLVRSMSVSKSVILKKEIQNIQRLDLKRIEMSCMEQRPASIHKCSPAFSHITSPNRTYQMGCFRGSFIALFAWRAYFFFNPETTALHMLERLQIGSCSKLIPSKYIIVFSFEKQKKYLNWKYTHGLSPFRGSVFSSEVSCCTCT